MGRILGLAASKYANLYAVVTESYASETRGGESRSDVIIASSMYEAPYMKVLDPDIAVFMYPYRLEYYKSLLKPHTTIVLDEEYVNTSAFRGYRVWGARFSEIAEKNLNTRRVANMVVLGRILREISLVSIDHVKKALEDLLPGSWLQINIKALELGYSLS